MALKSFNQLIEVDLKENVQKKPTFYRNDAGKLVPNQKEKWLDYIEWAVVLKLLYEHGAERVEFSEVINADGYVVWNPKGTKASFITVRVLIDEKEYTMNYPLIDGSKVIHEPDQMQLNKALSRAFVKCIAINTGLGLSMWMKDESVDPIPDNKPAGSKPSESRKKKMTSTQRVQCIKFLNTNGLAGMNRIKSTYDISEEEEERMKQEANI